MRLSGTVKNEQDAIAIANRLAQEQIQVSLEDGKKGIEIWVASDDDLARAKQVIDEYEERPSTNLPQKEPKRKPCFLTRGIIALCVFIFFLSWIQKAKNPIPDIALTPIAQTMLYDFPQTFVLIDQFVKTYESPEKIDPRKDFEQNYGPEVSSLPPAGQELFAKIQKTPYWQGLLNPTNAPLFEKIREGQVWRLISPVLLHGNVIHILFNLLWLWLLGCMIEERLRPFRYLILMVIIGIVSNTLQYLMSGPFFIGYSGIITGLAGFIWIRQKKAPWEGYPLQRITLVFLMVFIFGMAALSLGAFILEKTGITFFSMRIANIAHVAGFFTGMVCALLPFFSRQRSHK